MDVFYVRRLCLAEGVKGRESSEGEERGEEREKEDEIMERGREETTWRRLCVWRRTCTRYYFAFSSSLRDLRDIFDTSMRGK